MLFHVTVSYMYNLASIFDVNGSTTVYSATYTVNANTPITRKSSQPSSILNLQYSALNQVYYEASLRFLNLWIVLAVNAASASDSSSD